MNQFLRNVCFGICKSRNIRRGVLSLGAVGTGLFGYVRLVEPERPVVERVTVAIRDWPEHLGGMTIALLSDFHYHEGQRQPYIRRIIEQTNALNPDLIALTGDYISYYAGDIFWIADELARLRARFGVHAVLGNHDGRFGQPYKEIVTAYGLRQAGLCLLQNEAVVLDGFAVAGIESLFYGRPNLAHALRNVPDEMPVILLAHEPDYADFAVQDRRVKLQLSGHTHGGQVVFPHVKPLYLPIFGRKYLSGLYQIDDEMHLYVTRGVGVSHNGRFRFRCPPEITLLTITNHANSHCASLE